MRNAGLEEAQAGIKIAGSYRDKMKFQEDDVSFPRVCADPGPEGN